MKTTTDLIHAAQRAANEVPENLLPGIAARQAMRELLRVWHDCALLPGLNGDGLRLDLDTVIAHLTNVRRAVFAADDVALAAAVRQFAKTKAIATDAYDIARSHKAATANDRDALFRLMYGSPIHGDRDRLRTLADAIEKQESGSPGGALEALEALDGNCWLDADPCDTDDLHEAKALARAVIAKGK